MVDTGRVGKMNQHTSHKSAFKKMVSKVKINNPGRREGNCSRYMRRNTLRLRYMCRNAMVSPKRLEICCAVVSQDGPTIGPSYRVAERSPDASPEINTGRMFALHAPECFELATHVSNALGQSKCTEACCAVVSWDGTDPYRIAERWQMRPPEITRAGVSLFFVFRF